MGGCLLALVVMNAYSSVRDAELAKDSSGLQLSIAQRKLARREQENAVLLEQRQRWLAAEGQRAATNEITAHPPASAAHGR